MFLSENEIDARLAELRQQRDRAEREIADLVLYRELGRRLSGAETVRAPVLDSIRSSADVPVKSLDDTTLASTNGQLPAHKGEPAEARHISADGGSPDHGAPRRRDDAERDWVAPRTYRAAPERRSSPVPPVAFDEDPVAARRYGRAILDAALDGLREAGRPLHAGEILERVVARGYTVPGQDPVAALNTRLWKRSGPGGPLRRLGDAVYALAEPPAG